MVVAGVALFDSPRGSTSPCRGLGYQTCSILVLSVISALHHVPLFMGRIWLLLVPVETEVDLHTSSKVCSDSTRNEQVKTSGCLFGGSSANATLSVLERFFCFWKEFGKIC